MMRNQRIHNPSSWNAPSQAKNSSFAPRPFAVQAQQGKGGTTRANLATPAVQRPNRTGLPDGLKLGTVGRVLQRDLNAGERTDKLRILCDYVQFTPPNHEPFLDQYGGPPTTKVQYKLKLLEKIRGSAHIIRSLKSKATMVADPEDDNWNEGSFNVNTLVAAINDIYNDGLDRIDGARLIGHTHADFENHDCVWAAVAYGLGRADTLDEERAIAAEHSSQEGEVEDSILHRIMENLNWPFLGQGTFREMFPALRPGVATTDNIRDRYNGRYIISEDVNAGGTQGHVFAVDVLDVEDDDAQLGYRRDITFTDRQHERRSHDAARENPPVFQVHVWKVT